MGILSGYSDDTVTSDSDKFLTYASDGTTKLTPASHVNQYLGTGWTIASDSWSYSSYNSTTRVAVMNAASGANTLYGIGTWVKFTQPTLGIKYGRVIAVASSSITVKLNTGNQLDNEAITLPYYSASAAPFGSGGVVIAEQLATDAITLGYAQITSTFNTASATAVQVTSLTTTVTIPVGGRRIKITAFASNAYSTTTAGYIALSIWDGSVGTGTMIGRGQMNATNTTGQVPFLAMAVVTPSAGAKTYNVGLSSSAGTGSIEAATTYPAFLLVEAV